VASAPPAGHTIRIGALVATGAPYDLDLAALPGHTVVVAEQGRTVLLRRLVEQCAMRGVSAVVLDWDNEFVRLGEPWPQPPAGWAEGDAEAARQLLAATEIVVWTPGVDGGRPLFFPALPDFAALRADPDELRVAVDMAVGALSPWATVDGRLLREALTRFAEQGAPGGLRGLVAMLATSPAGSELAGALAEAMTADPLLDGGMPVDPGILFTPQGRKRARICVVSLAGLGTPVRQQTFVAHLQMALHAWLSRHAVDGGLRGLVVMDHAHGLVPPSGATACTASTFALVARARRHGLGMVFGIPEPGDVHHLVASNAATQFFGQPGPGVFSVLADGATVGDVAVPTCLTHHPAAPLSPAEVVARANTYPGA
jgi:hypothetical protein